MLNFWCFSGLFLGGYHSKRDILLQSFLLSFHWILKKTVSKQKIIQNLYLKEFYTDSITGNMIAYTGISTEH